LRTNIFEISGLLQQNISLQSVFSAFAIFALSIDSNRM
jgi:hypothetical protein